MIRRIATCTLVLSLALFTGNSIGSAQTAVELLPIEIETFADSPNVITKSQLDRLAFAASFSKEHLDRVRKVEKQVETFPDDENAKSDLAALTRQTQVLQSTPINLFMGKTKFDSNEPIYAYFVLKNERDEEVKVDFRLDFYSGVSLANNCNLHFECLTKPQPKSLAIIERTDGGPAMILPASSYYCVRLNLQKLVQQSAGNYRIHWSSRGLDSPTREFEVVRTEADPDPKMLEEKDIDVGGFVENLQEELLQKSGIETSRHLPLRSTDFSKVQLVGVRTDYFAAAMAITNEVGFAYPDIRDLPERDEWLESNLAFERPVEGQRPRNLILTLSTRDKDQRVRVKRAELERLRLILTYKQGGKVQKRAYDKVSPIVGLKKMERLKTFDRDQYAIEFEDDWLAEFGNEGEIQLQVVFCSETVELKIVGEESLKDLNEIEINNRFSENSQIHHWKGLLASPPISVDLADLSSLPLVQRETVPNNEEKRN